MTRVHILGMAAGILLAGTLTGCGGGSVAAPTEYATWNAKDGTFQLEYPQGWEANGGGKHGVQWARIKQKNAQIYVTVSQTESTIGDILGTGSGFVDDALPGALPEGADQFAPVATIHATKAEAMEEDYANYEEQEPVAFRPSLGDARKSEFVGYQGLGRKMHGYRATILNNQRGITVICACEDSDWETLQPVFDKILDGMRRGIPE